MLDSSVLEWPTEKVIDWARQENLSEIIINCLKYEEIDGSTLLALTENDIRDLRYKLNYDLKFGDIKSFWLAIRTIQKENSTQYNSLVCLGIFNEVQQNQQQSQQNYLGQQLTTTSDLLHLNENNERISPPLSVDGRATSIPPEFFKTFISVGYSFLVTWITAIVMVVVHERVPDMKRYPPLPDIFLDNVPHIPWAFHMCEITGTVLCIIWMCVCVFHKYRMVLLRRFFGIAGTVFLLRCVTMLITSLSVPGTHLQCNQNDYKVDDTNLTLSEALELRISRAYTIWSGLGMSIQGVRTCGDYMFSGHTVALTLLNFFITEYTPRNLYFLHTMTWLLNMFGIFFILAAHEHYSIDVFVAFYITSRLFLYYHTLANNQALMSHDSNRTRIWFPMFSYFESSVDGIIPNEYDNISTLLTQIFSCIINIKDTIMLTAQRWVPPSNQITLPLSKSLLSTLKSNTNINNSLISQTTTTTSTSTTTLNKKLSNNDLKEKEIDTLMPLTNEIFKSTDTQSTKINNYIDNNAKTSENLIMLNNDTQTSNNDKKVN